MALTKILDLPGYTPFETDALRSHGGVLYFGAFLTAETAAIWLQHNHQLQRNLRSTGAARLTRDMNNDHFVENGDTIRWSRTEAGEPVLIDGQHRCQAIVASGRTQWVLVAFDLPELARMTIDQGRVRSMGDVHKMNGEINTTMLAAVQRACYMWHLGFRGRTGKLQPSPHEETRFLDEHPEIREAVAEADRFRRRDKILAPSTMGLCWWLFEQISPLQCREFFERLTDGAMLHQHHPILTLRTRLIETRGARGDKDPVMHRAWMIKTWNAFRAGRPQKLIKWDEEREGFPEPL